MSRRGFTLLEVIVAAALIMALVGAMAHGARVLDVSPDGEAAAHAQ